MEIKRIESMEQVKQLTISPERKFYSATHEEILGGATTDVYFVKTLEILDHLKLGETPVVAEIFPRREGLLAGVQEVINLFSGRDVSIWSLPEGSSFKAKEVVMRLEGPYNQLGLYETALLGILASSSGWATAARAAKKAAGQKPVYCFGARHVHPAVAPVMERAALVGGADGASCILGAKLAGKEPVGTVPHAVFLIVGDTVKVARTYDEIMPPDALRLVLVDTFKDEAEEALRVAEALGKSLHGIRLDTPSERGGVTPELVKEVRSRLDMAGYHHVKIFVSGGLYPEKIEALAVAGADAFGVGSFISGAPPIDMTMDLKVVGGQAVAKRGRIPGITPNDRLQKVL
ncbi:nicotinate phosphoribosyltransferase [Calderihabitans maritimus]|uniref:Nicotinate phosphoribosyltransferase n=1 Tax=Calderihabitans maritimus TaxID=1246530 RepID=A0A1Z5HSJ8_9FIRM|nr:nicotinate phosphoribosyltransferase [Calderihabitans maritimus]GAW92398.1 nicotinate phosphoribosyltransferase [Calderihabitans maritimus]